MQYSIVYKTQSEEAYAAGVAPVDTELRAILYYYMLYNTVLLAVAAPLPPIGATTSPSISLPAGSRTRLNRTGRHRGIFWRPPCPTCHAGGFGTTHALDGRPSVSLPAYPSPLSPATVHATLPCLSSSFGGMNMLCDGFASYGKCLCMVYV